MHGHSIGPKEAVNQGSRWQQATRSWCRARLHGAGGRGYDGLLRIGTDGRLYIHSGVGNLGTYSYAATCRAAAEALQIPWERCEIVRGRSDRYLPHSSGQGGSNTIFTHTRTNWVAAQDAIAKMKEIAAMDLGGTADDYEIGDERVFKLPTTLRGSLMQKPPGEP